ncbi:AHH domain-containing protein [Bacillus toyonensis]|uniref:AHH domain-containing protein n=1 Tax=Bacillus toyonensis TaxID=155322 RepID=UPI001EDE7BD3|nr:AHH domain-containing protein [Bacillus toyonensis]MCG3797073.1 AHH domain-containing protein [Bacillus toyonensis]
MNAVCNATIQGMEQVIQSIDTFAIDTVLQGQTYSRAVEAQELLKEIEIHHDSASNGVFLPYKVNEYVTTEVLHIGSHSKEYIREVTERLNSVIEMGGTQADVAEVLHKIRQDLLEGKIRLNEPKK